MEKTRHKMITSNLNSTNPIRVASLVHLDFIFGEKVPSRNCWLVLDDWQPFFPKQEKQIVCGFQYLFSNIASTQQGFSSLGQLPEPSCTDVCSVSVEHLSAQFVGMTSEC